MASKLLRISKNFASVPQRFKSSHRGDYLAALASVPPTEVSTTNNNLKVASSTTPGAETTTVGLFLDAGARYEDASNNGAANLVQRLLLKGTAKRAQADLEAEVANMGARLYSCTSRERSALYGTCLTQDVPKLVEILSDAVQNPKLSAEDLEAVRKQILREADEIESSLQDVVFDYLHGAAFQGTPLAQTVLGTRENIKSLTSKDLKYYLDSNLKASRVVLAAAGGAKHSDLVQLAGQHLSKLCDSFDGAPPTLSRCRYTGSEIRLRDDSLPFAHVAIAVEGPGYNSSDRIPLLVATSAIGSYDRSLGKLGENSPYDVCHSYQAFNLTYSDTGLFGVYAICEPEQLEHIGTGILDAVHRVSYSITDAELEEAKNRLITKYLREIDTTKGNCEDIANSVLSTGRRAPIAEIEAAIANVSNQTVRNVTDKYTNNKCPVVSAVGPIESLMDYVNLRTRMYWARI